MERRPDGAQFNFVRDERSVHVEDLHSHALEFKHVVEQMSKPGSGSLFSLIPADVMSAIALCVFETYDCRSGPMIETAYEWRRAELGYMPLLSFVCFADDWRAAFTLISKYGMDATEEHSHAEGQGLVWSGRSAVSFAQSVKCQRAIARAQCGIDYFARPPADELPLVECAMACAEAAEHDEPSAVTMCLEEPGEEEEEVHAAAGTTGEMDTSGHLGGTEGGAEGYAEGYVDHAEDAVPCEMCGMIIPFYDFNFHCNYECLVAPLAAPGGNREDNGEQYLEELVSMGFDQGQACEALVASGCISAQAALDWIRFEASFEPPVEDLLVKKHKHSC
jgi:hypothetical protein